MKANRRMVERIIRVQRKLAKEFQSARWQDEKQDASERAAEQKVCEQLEMFHEESQE